MEAPINLLALKESLIEFVTENNYLDFANDIDIGKTLTSMSSLDTRALEADPFKGAQCFGRDLEKSLADIEAENQRAKTLHNQLQLLKHDQTRLRVGALLVEELREAGFGDDVWQGKMILDVARTIANHRISAKTIRYDRPKDFLAERRRYEFCIYLAWHRGGYGGEMQYLRLYFSYQTDVALFLVQLRQETALCTIPPWKTGRVGVGMGLGTGNAAVSFRGKQADMEEFLNGPMERKDSSGVSSQESGDVKSKMRTQSPAIARAPEIQNNGPRGYTLDHGPWTYRIALSETEKGPLTDLATESDYKGMLKQLKEQKGKANVPAVAIVMHSMEVKAKEAYAKDMEASSQALEITLKEAAEEWKEGEEDDEDTGELRSEWCARKGYSIMGPPEE